MPRPTAAQFAYGILTTVAGATAMLLLSGTGSGVGAAVVALAALALGLLVAVAVPLPRTGHRSAAPEHGRAAAAREPAGRGADRVRVP
jgi:hypothetical protein